MGPQLKAQYGEWLILEDPGGEYYANETSGECFPTMPAAMKKAIRAKLDKAAENITFEKILPDEWLWEENSRDFFVAAQKTLKPGMRLTMEIIQVAEALVPLARIQAEMTNRTGRAAADYF